MKTKNPRQAHQTKKSNFAFEIETLDPQQSIPLSLFRSKFQKDIKDLEQLFLNINQDDEKQIETEINQKNIDEQSKFIGKSDEFLRLLAKSNIDKNQSMFKDMLPMLNAINKLLEYRQYIPENENEIIHAWKSTMIDCLSIAIIYLKFLNDEKNRACIQIAESLFKFAFGMEFSKVYGFESKLYGVLREFETFLWNKKPVFCLESSTGSGKTRCVPFFLSIRAYHEHLKHPFNVMTQPSSNIIESKIEDFKAILPNVIVLTNVKEILDYYQMPKIRQPILCLLTPYSALKLIQRSKQMHLDIFPRTRWVLDEVHERTVYIDTIIGFLRQELDRINNFPGQITLMTATMDRSIQKLLGFDKCRKISIDYYTPFYVEEIKDSCKSMQEIPNSVTKHTFSILKKMVDKQLDPGHILVFVAGNADCQSVLRRIKDRFEQNNQKDKIPIKYLPIEFSDDSTEKSIYKQISEKAVNPEHLYVVPIQLAGFVSHVQKVVAQKPIPKLKNVVKVIVSTNIVESSITILDLAAVIDTGLVRQARFDHETEITKITKETVSEKMAIQRRCRVGRTRVGVYVNIVNGKYHDIEPLIKISDLSTSILKLRAIGIKLEEVDKLPDKPDPRLVLSSIDGLKEIGALDENGDITPYGFEIHKISYEFSPYFACALLKIRSKRNEYEEILAALVILIMTTERLIVKQNSPALEKNYDEQSDIITLLRTFNKLFENSYQYQKDNCIRFGLDPNNFGRLITSFSNFIHKVFKRDRNDKKFLAIHFKKIRELISSIDLMKFVDFVIESIREVKPVWVNNRLFTFDKISGLNTNPSINAVHKMGTHQRDVRAVVGSRPGWRGIECCPQFYLFSLFSSNGTIFGTIMHRYEQQAPGYQSFSYRFDKNISIPFFTETLNCLNANNGENQFLPMQLVPKNQSDMTTIVYKSIWKSQSYLSFCAKYFCKQELDQLIDDTLKIMPFVGKSVFVPMPQNQLAIEIFSIGASHYSAKVHTINDHGFAYKFKRQMLFYLLTHISELSKNNPSIRISINIKYITNKVENNQNALLVISDQPIFDTSEMNWSYLIRNEPRIEIDHFIEEVNSIAPSIATAASKRRQYYCHFGKHQPVSEFISDVVKNQLRDDILVKPIEKQKIFFGQDIDYSIEKANIESNIENLKRKIRAIDYEENNYYQMLDKYEIDKIEYVNAMEKYNSDMQMYQSLMNASEYISKVERPDKQQNQNDPNQEIKEPQKPKFPKEPIKPNFSQNEINKAKYENEICLNEKLLSPINQYFKSQSELRGLGEHLKICGTEGCIVENPRPGNDQIDENDRIIQDNNLQFNNPSRDITFTFRSWTVDPIDLYTITIIHHALYAMTETKFKETIQKNCDNFAAFATISEYYSKLDTFGQLGQMKITIIGKQLVIPFIKTVLNELENNCEMKHEFDLSNTIISNNAIQHEANIEYFINLMRNNEINISLDGPIVTGELNDVKNAFNLINQPRVEILFPFLSMKIPECIFVENIDIKLAEVNNTKAKNKQWARINNEIVFPREDLVECQRVINRLAGPKTDVHGCIYYCEKPELSSKLLPVYQKDNTITLLPFCVNCLNESFHYATNNFFNLKYGSFSKEFLENNIEAIPAIGICEDENDENTSETWPMISMSQLLFVLQDHISLREMANAWIRGIVEQTIRTCPSIITCCPKHPQKKFIVNANGIRCTCPTCKLCYCGKCKSWHDPNESCPIDVDSIPHCPKCGIPTYKFDGCNHITCKCGAHWCYKCGAGPFTESNECYKHMNEKHGSYYKNYLFLLLFFNMLVA